MAANLNVDTFQVALETAEKEEPVEEGGATPGSENPQITSAIVRALKTNAGIVWVGGIGNANPTKGFELAAGDAISVDVQGLKKLKAYATKAKDRLCVLWVGP
jgi:hypothetical protein